MTPIEIAYVIVLGCLTAASVYGVWAEEIDDNTLQRVGMVFTIFGAVGEIQGTARGVDTVLSPYILGTGLGLFTLGTLIRYVRKTAP